MDWSPSLKESFLCAAARGGRLQECASLLDDFGADVEWTDENNNSDSPMLAAVRSGHQDVAALLLAHGANPERRDIDGNTVFHLAAMIGDQGMASLFSPNATLSLTSNDDRMTAIDIAVQRGYNSFAEHLNNLLYEADEEYHEVAADEEKEDPSIVEDTSTAESNDAEEYESGSNDEASFATPAAGNDESQYRSTSVGAADMESRFVDDEIPFDAIIGTDRVENVLDRGESSEVEDDSSDGTDPEELMNQLSHMTQLAHIQSRELYQAKYALSELMAEHDTLKEELAIFCGEDDDTESSLSQKTLAELNSLEQQVKRSLERIVKAKEVTIKSMEEDKEDRVCVICKENPKSVLLMNCRHLCVCNECGHLDVLVQCPLCRELIAERINVFA